MEYKTIIMLSFYRSGSTMMFDVFRKHPQTKIAHINQKIKNFEPGFWTNALSAVINKNPKNLLNDRFFLAYPFCCVYGEKFKDTISTEQVFILWNRILKYIGPIVFDKSPKYLLNYDVFPFIRKYINSGNRIKIFAMIRDPRDVIISAYSTFGNGLSFWESQWIIAYKNLERLLQSNLLGNIIVYKYEDIVNDSKHYFKEIFDFCEIENDENCFKHVKSIPVGRYKTVKDTKIKNWLNNTDPYLNHMIEKYYVG